MLYKLKDNLHSLASGNHFLLRNEIIFFLNKIKINEHNYYQFLTKDGIWFILYDPYDKTTKIEHYFQKIL